MSQVGSVVIVSIVQCEIAGQKRTWAQGLPKRVALSLSTTLLWLSKKDIPISPTVWDWIKMRQLQGPEPAYARALQHPFATEPQDEKQGR